MYTHHSFSSYIFQEPSPLSPLRSWKHDPGCLCSYSVTRSHHVKPTSVFHPFPDIWGCRIVVPYALPPPTGSVECYHNFLHAMCWLKTLRAQLDCFYFAPTVEVFLLCWCRPRLPTSSEVLEIFNCHPSVIYAISDQPHTSPLAPEKFGLYFSQFSTVNPGVGWDTAFHEWFPLQLGRASVAFACEKTSVVPTPCFAMTTIAPGWVGGMLYAS